MLFEKKRKNQPDKTNIYHGLGDEILRQNDIVFCPINLKASKDSDMYSVHI
jgi:hypothetical protein